MLFKIKHLTFQFYSIYFILEPKVTKAVEISNNEGPQIIKEETKVEKMQAETKGALLVKDKKVFCLLLN